MISPELLTVLLDRPAFKEYKKELNNGVPLSKMPAPILRRMGAEIKNVVDYAVAQNDDLAKFLPNDFIGDPETMRKLLSDVPSGNEFEKRRIKSRNVLLVYALIDKADWPLYELKREEKHFAEKAGLLGDWYVYRFGNGKNRRVVERTILSLQKEDGFVKITFRSLLDYYRYGRLITSGRLLTFRFERSKTLEITARLPEHLIEKEIVLNAILRSTIEQNPFAKPCVLVRMKKSADERERQTVMSITSDAPAWEGVDTVMQQQVLKYLGSIAEGTEAVLFESPDVQGLKSYNEARSNKKFHPLFAKSIVGSWYSICLSPDDKSEVSIKQWHFAFDQTGSNLTARCNKKGAGEFSLEGDVELTGEQITLQMNNTASYEKIFITARFNSAKPNKLYAITSKINQGKSFRELFISSSLCPPFSEGRMSVEEFIEAKMIDDHESMLLLDAQNNPLHWPDISESYKRQTNKLLKYCGRYLAYIPNFYPKEGEGKSLFQITLEIDKAGRVIEKTLDNRLEHPLTYMGRAVLLNNTLRLTNENDDMQRSEYLITINTQESGLAPCLLGITLDTDNYGSPCADACIIVPYQFLSFPFEPRILVEGTADYQQLSKYVLEKAALNIKDFFYIRYPSIRRVTKK